MATPGGLTATDFRSLHRHLRAAAPGAASPRGALDTITADAVLAAAREVRSGRTVPLAAPADTGGGPDDPEPADPAEYRLSTPPGVLPGVLPSGGASALPADLARDGVVGRGVLLDIPRLHGRSWLEPGTHVTADDLAAAEVRQGVRTGRGDILLVRVGHHRRREELGPWDTAHARAGLHPTAMEFLAERQVSVLGSDGNSDTAPSPAEGIDFPVHVLAVHAMGVHLLDYLRFEELAPLCAQLGRWSFLCVIAPLRIPGVTGSPVSPIAIL